MGGHKFKGVPIAGAIILRIESSKRLNSTMPMKRTGRSAETDFPCAGAMGRINPGHASEPNRWSGSNRRDNRLHRRDLERLIEDGEAPRGSLCGVGVGPPQPAVQKSG